MLRCAQHDRTESVIPNASEESTAWMLRCAQHDRMGTAKLTLLSLSLQKERGWQPHPVALRRPSPSQGEGRFGESQNRVRSHGLPSTFLSFRAFSFVIPSALFCHSERQRGIQCVGSLQKERDVCKANRGRSIPCMDIKPLTEKNAAAYAQYLTNMRDQIGSNAPATGKDYRHPCVPAIVGQAER